MPSSLQDPINEKFDEIEEILRDDAHEGIGEAIHDLRNLVHRLLLRYESMQNIMNSTYQALSAKNDELDK